MTTLVTPLRESTVDDGAAITELHRLYALQRQAFLADPYPDVAKRRDLRAAGARVVSLGGDGDPATRRLPLLLVVDPPKSLRIMQEEIFGPILPVIPYDDLDEALAELNAGERPLGLYVFSKDPQVAEHVLRQTTSGGACVNICAVQGALPSLGFGGIGQSGNGRHHGIEGFREFSDPRGVVVRGTGDLTDAFLPPYGPAAQAIVDSVFNGAADADAATPGDV
jgi:coniferyl-aldehyde dehydrogenase